MDESIWEKTKELVLKGFEVRLSFNKHFNAYQLVLIKDEAYKGHSWAWGKENQVNMTHIINKMEKDINEFLAEKQK